MQGLIGRRASHPEILEVRELTLAEVKATPRAAIERIKKLRDSHHAAARLLAMGMPQGDVAGTVGYSINGLSTLCQSPAFQELVAHYREMITDEWKGNVDEYYSTLVNVRMKSLRMISDKLDDAEPGDIPLNQLSTIHSDAADRSGYPKRKESVNLNLDFADRLDAAVRRSREVKEIELKATQLPVDGAGTETGGPSGPPTIEARSSPNIRDLLPPTRQEKALLRRA